MMRVWWSRWDGGQTTGYLLLLVSALLPIFKRLPYLYDHPRITTHFSPSSFRLGTRTRLGNVTGKTYSTFDPNIRLLEMERSTSHTCIGFLLTSWKYHVNNSCPRCQFHPMQGTTIGPLAAIITDIVHTWYQALNWFNQLPSHRKHSCIFPLAEFHDDDNDNGNV